jgi:hypothetical protein
MGMSIASLIKHSQENDIFRRGTVMDEKFRPLQLDVLGVFFKIPIERILFYVPSDIK